MDAAKAPAVETAHDVIEMIKRNTHFNSSWLPFRREPDINIHRGTVTGAFDWLNPTQANFTQAPIVRSPQEFDTTDENALPANVEYHWTSRNNRKGRHAITVSPTDIRNDKFSIPPSSSSPRRILHGILRMITVFPITNISWQIAITFTLGSIIWIITSFFTFLPYVSTKYSALSTNAYGSGYLACIGSSSFFLASNLLVLELFNANESGCLGWKVEQVWDSSKQTSTFRVVPDKGQCSHEQGNREDGSSWLRVPTWGDLREHYVYELSFWATMVQVSSSLMFLWSGIVTLPSIYDTVSQDRVLLDGVFWSPKLIACCGFVVAGVLDTLETQESYLRPAWGTLGWWTSLWKTLGGLGFLLMACFGFGQATWEQYASGLASVIGSWAFLIASLLLWFEVLAQYPVEVVGWHEDEEKAVGGENDDEDMEQGEDDGEDDSERKVGSDEDSI